MEILDILEEKEDRAIINCLMAAVDKPNIRSICDYGCGDGRVLKKIKKRLPSGIRYTGIDFWSNEYSNHTIPEDEESINFIDNGSPEIDEFLENNHYDLVFSSFALHHFRLPVKELKRMERLVAPEGVLVLIDMFRDYTDIEKIADNVNFFNSKMMMMALRGDYHRIPYTREETCDLLLALDMEITDQKVVAVDITEKELAEFKRLAPEWYKKKAEKEYQDDVSKNRHPAFLDAFRKVQQFTMDLIDRYGTTPDSLLVTTAKKTG
ncbi:MAG: class I SAM-dependent methyltransferase [Thermodesulfobacteriota bacterium]|nr:class I SAM-dependent methyltransferase [Thermodesulfobacteriota bacterium]